jgi:hypothetical protein
MPLADDDGMVKAFPPDRANQPFRMSIPPLASGARLDRVERGRGDERLWLTRPTSGIEFTIRTARSRIHCRDDTLAQVLRVSSPHQGSPVESRRGITNSAAPESSPDSINHEDVALFSEADRFVGNSRSDWLFVFLERFPTPVSITAPSLACHGPESVEGVSAISACETERAD